MKGGKITRRDFIKTLPVLSTGFLVSCKLYNQFDILIKSGIVYDGEKNQISVCDIGIRGDVIKAVEKQINSSADIVIDAKGLVVSPGFIDIHTHTDIELLINPTADSKIMQGVTTEVSGNCGFSPFPLNDQQYRDYRDEMNRKYGVSPAWHSLNQFLEQIEISKPSINYLTLTGHGRLRSYILGNENIQPSPEQLRNMKKLLQQTLEEGSFGLSTGLEYSPGCFATIDELIELCKVVKRYDGLYATHMRNEDDTLLEAINEALEISRKSGVNLEISHLKACNVNNWGKIDTAIAKIEEASKTLPVHADRYPYNAWGTSLTTFLPKWARTGSSDDIIKRLKDKKTFKEITSYMYKRANRIGGWDKIMISRCNSAKNKVYEGKTLAQCSEISGLEPTEFVKKILIEEKTDVSIIGFAMSEENLKKVLKCPLVMIGSDGNAISPKGILGKSNPHPRYYGTFPRVLGKYCRDEGIISLLESLSKMTAMPAKKLGLNKRGFIKKGYYADITIFDFKKIIDKATYVNPHQFPEGIAYVIVNGKITVKNGRHLGTRAGKVLRK